MLSRYKIKKWFQFSRWKIIVVVCCFILLFCIVNLCREVAARRQLDQEIADMNDQIKYLSEDNEELAKLIQEWQAGSRLEKEARLKFGLKKPGENAVAIIRDQEIDDNLTVGNVEIIGNTMKAKDQEKSNFIKWLRYFFN